MSKHSGKDPGNTQHADGCDMVSSPLGRLWRKKKNRICWPIMFAVREQPCLLMILVSIFARSLRTLRKLLIVFSEIRILSLLSGDGYKLREERSCRRRRRRRQTCRQVVYPELSTKIRSLLPCTWGWLNAFRWGWCPGWVLSRLTRLKKWRWSGKISAPPCMEVMVALLPCPYCTNG